MKKKILLPAFIIMALLQLYVPAKMISGKENVLAEGNEFMFKTAPIDPSDPFRGKYIVLSFEENTAQVANAEDWNSGDPVYVSLTKNEEGFAKILTISKDEPLETPDYVKANIQYTVSDSISHIMVEYPFDRYYMEESKAPQAEIAYNESARDSTQITYALVSVKNGDAVLQGVFINGVPIREIILSETEGEN